MADERDRGLQRHGDPDGSQWQEAPALNARPQDTASRNTTFADRARGQNKAVQSADSKDADLSDLTVTELKAQAKAAGVTGYSSMTKDELVKALG